MSVTPVKPVLVGDNDEIKRPSREQALEAVRTLLAWAGDNPDREGLKDTPKRVVDAYAGWFDGYGADAARELCPGGVEPPMAVPFELPPAPA